MIAKREEWIAARKPPVKRPPVGLVIETEALNAHEALVLLGIATPDTRDFDPTDPYERLLLEPWAVQAALKRRQRDSLSDKDITEIQRRVRAPKTIIWP